MPDIKKRAKSIFSDIYHNNIWDSNESVSGPGSTLEHTTVIRKELPILIKEFNIKTVLDIPCGDYNWMKEIKLDLKKYIGYDIVPEIIIKNTKIYGNKKIEFKEINMIDNTLPSADLIICRDGLVHLSFKDIKSTIENFKKSKSKYLLTTTFTRQMKNKDILTGEWRLINLQEPPFNFPKAIKTINEKYKGDNGMYSDRCLCLYKIKDIKVK